jgi:FkbM family methyltransferase
MNLKSTTRDNNLIYDVGMHKGQDTDFYLKKGFKVVAFEANPENINFCKRRFAEAIKDKRLTIVEGAIVENAARTGQETVRFYLNKNHSFWGSTSDDWAYRNEVMGTTNEMIEVGAVDFGKTIEQYGIPYYLKADIVGSETICLKALLAFENKPEYLSIRSEKVIFSRLEDEFVLLERLGYDKFKAIQQDVSHIQTTFTAPNGENITHLFEEGGSGFFGEETGGRWKTKEEVLKEYRRIFTLYWLFGDYSYLIQTEKGKKIIAQLERVAKRPLPGWYDTHAKHSSVNS